MYRYAMADGILSETTPKCRKGCSRSYKVLGEGRFLDDHGLGSVDEKKIGLRPLKIDIKQKREQKNNAACIFGRS